MTTNPRENPSPEVILWLIPMLAYVKLPWDLGSITLIMLPMQVLVWCWWMSNKENEIEAPAPYPPKRNRREKRREDEKQNDGALANDILHHFQWWQQSAY